ncbi:FCRLA protein, partial [Grallaria varia]|nr:FCRLA protein [Grallaria varia]
GHPCPADWLVLHVPARRLLEGDTVTLRCRREWEWKTTKVQFYHEEKHLGGLEGTELSLSPLQLHHSGQYQCWGRVVFSLSPSWEESTPVTLRVHGEHPIAHNPE